MKSDIQRFFTLHRQIFGVCPNCAELFRLSDCRIYLRKKPEADWMDALDREIARLDKLEEKIELERSALQQKGTDAGRKEAKARVRQLDPVCSPLKLDPQDAKAMFHPVDYVVFNGMHDCEPIKNVMLLDGRTRSAERRRLQKSIERAVEKERYEWQTMRVLDDGALKVE